MASAPGYSREVTPGGTAGAPAQATPDAFGAGVGEAITQVGGDIGQIQRQRRALRDDQQLSAFNSSFAQLRSANDKAQSDLQTNAAPGGDGYHQAVTGMVSQQGEQLLGTITDPKLRARAQAQWDGYAAEQDARAYEWQAGKQAIKTVTDATDTAATGANRVLTGGATAYADETGHWHDYVHSLTGIGDDAKDKLLKHGDEQLGIAQISRLRSSNPQAAVALIDSGAFNDALTPEQLEQARRGAEVDVRTADAQAKAAQKAALSGQVHALDLTGQTYEQGRPTFDQARALANQYDQAATAGDDAAAAKAQTWRAKADEIGASEQWRGADPTARNARIAQLEAAPTLSAQQGSELKGLKSQAEYVDKLPTIDRYAYATGKAAAPLDWNNPASVQARLALVATAQQKYGGLGEILTPAETKPLTDIASRGSLDDKIGLAHQLAALGSAGGAIAMQITPKDPGFRAVLSLAPIDPDGTLMHDALAGPAALKANNQLLVPQKDETGHRGINHEELFVQQTSRATAALPEDQRQALLFNATNIYAARAGAQGWTMFHPNEFNRAINLALGAKYTPNGWVGGMGQSHGENFVLPQGMAQSDWNQSIARATPDQWGAAATKGVGMVGGRIVTTGELRGMVPVRVPGGYALRSGNTYLTTKNGQRFEFDPAKLK